MTFFDCHATKGLAMTGVRGSIFVYKMLNILKLDAIENINLLIILLTFNSQNAK